MIIGQFQVTGKLTPDSGSFFLTYTQFKKSVPSKYIKGVPQKMSFSDFLALTDVFLGFWTATPWLTFNLNGGCWTDILL